MGRKRKKSIRVTEEEFKMFRDIQKQCDKVDLPVNQVKHGWAKSKKASVFWKNPFYKDPQVLDYMDLRDSIIKLMDEHSPKYPKITRKHNYLDNMAFLSLADFHFNKLCEKSVSGDRYDLDEALQRLTDGVNNLLALISTFKVEQFCLVIGNDILNSDTVTNTTTNGTPQDNDKHWTTAYELAKLGLIHVIEMLVQVAPVHIVHCPSNHDYQSGFFLADSVKSWFRNLEDVTFDTTIRHRKYYQYGNNMIEMDHGDGCKVDDTPQIMAEEERFMWANCIHRYSYKAHFHHKDKRVFQKQKEYPGVIIEFMSSPSPKDEWHDRKGYLSRPALEIALHNRQRGKFGHFTHRFV